MIEETEEDLAARERMLDQVERNFYKHEGERLFGKGEAAQAIDFALDKLNPIEGLDFLRAWREGDTSEWPEWTIPEKDEQ